LNSSHPIGIFDSGIGGLTVANAINKVLPDEQIIYFGDTQHLPYGNKSHQKINGYCIKIVDFLLQKKCKAIVIGCNSASSVAYKSIVEKVKNTTLVINVIDPVVNYIVSNKSIKKVGIIGTNATISSQIYEKKITSIRNNIKVYSVATPLLASLIEEDNHQLYKTGIIESYLQNEKLQNIDSLILGCTHYPLIESQINNFYSEKMEIVSSTKYVGNMLKKELANKNLLNTKNGRMQHEFYISDYTKNFQEKTKLFFPSSIILEEENIFS